MHQAKPYHCQVIGNGGVFRVQPTANRVAPTAPGILLLVAAVKLRAVGKPTQPSTLVQLDPVHGVPAGVARSSSLLNANRRLRAE